LVKRKKDEILISGIDHGTSCIWSAAIGWIVTTIPDHFIKLKEKKIMKKIFIAFMILAMCFCFGCSQTINLTEAKIIKKITINDEYAEYSISENDDFGLFSQYIIADPNFAQKGDTIGSVDGVIKVIKKAEK
jgi:hypothetical protein